MTDLTVFTKILVCHLLLLDIWILFHGVQGFGFNIGACKDEKFDCDCGTGTGRTVPVYQQQCNFVSGWEVWCRSCENGIEVFKDDVCRKNRKYHLCAECEAGLKGCSSCPVGFFGNWCDHKCDCLNGGTCAGSSNNCICPPGFEGSYCERRTSCEVPSFRYPMKVLRIPETNTGVLELSCGGKGFLLKGVSRMTCNFSTGRWNQRPPICMPACSLPDAPRNGRLVNDELDDLVKSGDRVSFECRNGFTLLGASDSVCLNGSSWSEPVPSCVKLVFCPKPPPEPNTRYTASGPDFYPPFSNGTQLEFHCTNGYLLMGRTTVICGQDGTWSSRMPLCINVPASEIDCDTIGYEIVSAVGHTISLQCPAGCASGQTGVWGTVIYDESSSVCRAALHAGQISNIIGGTVFVINTGVFVYFIGTNANGVESERKETMGGSFRFQIDRDLGTPKTFQGCPLGWREASNHCFYTILEQRTWKDATSICRNLGSSLPTKEEAIKGTHLLQSMEESDVFKSFWLLNQKNFTKEISSNDLEEDFKENVFSNETRNNDTIRIFETVQQCMVMIAREGITEERLVDCGITSSFVCHINLEDRPKSCKDPGLLENGLVELKTPGKGHFIGSVLLYKCMSLYYMEGDPSAVCNENGMWSSNKPLCRKVPTCPDPSVPAFGSFDVTMPSASSRKPGQSAPGSRRSRFGVISRPRQSRSLGTDLAQMSLPQGYHHIGSQATFRCNSKYYDLIGSQKQRCQPDGSWSGRHPSCIPICGRSDYPRTPFIVNGNASEIGQWPWQIGIGFLYPGVKHHQLLCGGSLISELWVLTAAHCVTEDSSISLLSTDTLQIYAGKYFQDEEEDDEFVQTRKVVEVHVHQDYDPSVFDADIALIRLDSPLELTSRVQPVCLPSAKSTRNNLVDGRKGVVTGWGLTEDHVYAPMLRQAVVHVVSSERCEKGYEDSGTPLTVSENMFCAGVENGTVDACSGDSGGPLVFLMGQRETKYWVLEGIVSWGSLQGCAIPNQFGGFTAVHRFLEWIHEFV